MENNVFLARLVTFDFQSILFKINELESSIDTEEYRLVSVYGDRAYDLMSPSHYVVLNRTNGIISSEDLNKIRPNIQYVYDMCPFKDFYDSIKMVYNISATYEEFVNHYKEDIIRLNEILSSENKVIDFYEVKKLTNKRKY